MASTSNEGTSDDLNRYVIVGGGIAGVSCAEEVINSNLPHMHIIPTLQCKIQEVSLLIFVYLTPEG